MPVWYRRIQVLGTQGWKWNCSTWIGQIGSSSQICSTKDQMTGSHFPRSDRILSSVCSQLCSNSSSYHRSDKKSSTHYSQLVRSMSAGLSEPERYSVYSTSATKPQLRLAFYTPDRCSR
jgi:hypothetical protein